MEKKLLNGRELAQYLGMSYFHIMYLAENGFLPSLKIGRARRFHLKEVMDWIRSGKIEKKKAELAGA